ncbi:cell wall metabolism sensor histidine kinase WalK [Acaryochloris sp. CCMEE 5410]|uniref:sensor histidine kinase n=1 Tax=Acaryochloris sp. CCMEE 5410 TaxID=310037 RepID=UPI0002484CB8|nr:HAMP domain-containing sensor histidine kinase [Acaryochloris sp. CCMEE 5410]KAI9133058.1 two-component sensor histidine kinase [Acaryochloris sp. CCMEE 5410]
MQLVWFLAGLGLGLGLLAWSARHFNHQLERIIRTLPSDPYRPTLSPLSRLSRVTLQLQDQLQLNEQELLGWQDILRRAPVGYLQVNSADNLYWINERACDLLKLQSRSWDAWPNRLLLEVVRSIELDQLISQVRSGQQEHQIEWIMHLSERAQEWPLRAYGIPLPEGHVGVFIEDRTEAKNLAEDRDRWTSDVAHELKTPLTSIRLMVETLEPRISWQHRSHIDRLLQEVTRLSDLVKDLLELSRITFNQAQTLKLQPVNVPSLIHKAWLNLEPLAQQRNLSLFYQGVEDCTLNVDKNRLYRVFLNLIDNAIKYSPVDQPIIVQVEVVQSAEEGEQGQRLRIDIIDTGSGFSVESLPHIFKRFYRSDPSRVRGTVPMGNPEAVSLQPLGTSDVIQATSVVLSEQEQASAVAPLGGSGLGLAIAQQIILAHGGTIRARNHPQTGGAWLQIMLPCPQASS